MREKALSAASKIVCVTLDPPTLCTLEKARNSSFFAVTNYRFDSVSQVLSFLQFHNPARQKSINLLERESYSQPEYFSVEVSGKNGETEIIEDSAALWCVIHLLVQSTFKLMGAPNSVEVKAFYLWRLHPSRRPALDDLAAELGKSERTVKRYIRQVREELDFSFQKAGLLPPLSERESA